MKSINDFFLLAGPGWRKKVSSGRLFSLRYVNKGSVKKKWELGCSFVNLLIVFVVLFKPHAKMINEKLIFDMSDACRPLQFFLLPASKIFETACFLHTYLLPLVLKYKLQDFNIVLLNDLNYQYKFFCLFGDFLQNRKILTNISICT